MRASRGLKWENKMYKRKRSISCLSLPNNNIWLPHLSFVRRWLHGEYQPELKFLSACAGWNTVHLVSSENNLTAYAHVFFSARVEFPFRLNGLFADFSTPFVGFWNRTRIFSQGWNSAGAETSMKSPLSLQEDLFHNPGWNSPCYHPLKLEFSAFTSAALILSLLFVSIKWNDTTSISYKMSNMKLLQNT